MYDEPLATETNKPLPPVRTRLQAPAPGLDPAGTASVMAPFTSQSLPAPGIGREAALPPQPGAPAAHGPAREMEEPGPDTSPEPFMAPYVTSTGEERSTDAPVAESFGFGPGDSAAGKDPAPVPGSFGHEPPAMSADTPIANEIAERLLQLGERVRQQGTSALQVETGDQLDILLRSVLSAYITGRADS